MASSWPSVQLGDVVELTTGFPFNSNRYAKDPTGIRLLRGDNVAQGVLQWDGAKRWPCSEVESLQEYLLKEGDVILAMDRPWIDRGLKYASIHSVDLPALLVQRVARLRGKERLDTRYLMYIIGGESFTNYILGTQTGTTIPHISAGQIRGFRFALPPLPVQRAIAHTLGTLDDKIELNRRMNETLESMARALFKSWFIDFDPVHAKADGRDPGLPADIATLFLSSFEDSDLGEIPKGWKVDTVGEHMNNFDSKRIPVSGAERAKRQGPYPYHGAAGVMDYVDDYLFDGIYLLVGEDGSVMQNNGVAVTQYVWGKMWVNNHAHVMQGNGMVSTEQLYLYFHVQPVRPYVTGAVQPKLSQGRMNMMPFLFAGDRICNAFSEEVRAWFAKYRSNANESKTLVVLRDALLPRLLSGELHVPLVDEPLMEFS